MQEERIEQRKEKLKKFLKDPYNLALILILVAGFILRVYYLSYTSGQTLWWDEAEYGSMAKHFVLGIPYNLNVQRPFMFPGVISILMLLSLSEQVLKFLVVLVPSTLLILFIFLLGKEMFNKKVAIIAAILAVVSWTFVFWTPRLQPDFFSMCFQVLAILFMWKFFKNNKIKFAVFSGIFASLGFQFKVSGMLVPAILFFFILLKDRASAFKNKGYWMFLLAFVISYTPQAIYSYYAFNNPFAIFGTNYVTVVTDTAMPFGWYNFKFYYYFTENVLFYLFMLGVIFSLEFLLYLEVLLKDKSKWMNPNIFSIFLFLFVSAYYIFWIKGTDDRWVFLWLPFIFFMIGNALVSIYTFVSKYNKILAIGIVILLLGFGSYSQLKHADLIIKNKAGTYAPVKEAALWMKENSNSKDTLATASVSQTTYYAEREVTLVYNKTTSQYYSNEKELEEAFKDKKPKFLAVSVFEPAVPQWINSYPQNYPGVYKLVNAWFQDVEQQQLILVIYEINYTNLFKQNRTINRK